MSPSLSLHARFRSVGISKHAKGIVYIYKAHTSFLVGNAKAEMLHWVGCWTKLSVGDINHSMMFFNKIVFSLSKTKEII